MSKPKLRNGRAEVPKQERAEQAQEPPRKRRLGWFTPEWVTAWGTVLLAIFAFFAWREATEGTRAMQGQLNVMLAQQEPTISIRHEGPTFDPEYGRIHWNIYFQNVGKGVAYDFKHEAFIKTGKQFADGYGGTGPYVMLDQMQGSQFIAGQTAFVTLLSQEIGMDEPTAHKILDSGDLAVMIHFRFRITPNGWIKDQWFCSSKTGDYAIFDIPPIVCMDSLPLYIPRPKSVSAAEEPHPQE